MIRLADGDEARERSLRDWFSERLIAAGGVRGQVLRGVGQSEGLANELVEGLLDSHLVRAEKRAGATWYELAHDRLIEPVVSANAAWRSEHLSEVQQRATLWERQGRPPGLLLADQELAAGERWAVAAVAVTDVERRFLDQSRAAQAAVERERRQASWIKNLAVVASVVSLLALGATAVAVWKYREAEHQKELAIKARDEARQAQQKEEKAKDDALVAQQKEEVAKDDALAAQQKEEVAKEDALAAQQKEEVAKEDALAAQEQERIAKNKAVAAQKLEQEAKETALAARELEQKAKEDALAAKQEEARAKERAERLRRIAEAKALAIRTLGLQDDAQRELAALLAVEAYRLNRRSAGQAEDPDVYNALRLTAHRLGTERVEVLHSHRGEVRALAMAPDGRRIASGSEDGEVRLADLDRPRDAPTVLADLDSGVRSLAFGPAGRQLAVGSRGGALRIWDLQPPWGERGGRPAVPSPRRQGR